MSMSTAPAWAAIKDVFDQCASEARTAQKGRKDKPVPLEIQSEEEFEALLGGLLSSGLICASDAAVLERIWAEVVVQASAFGQRRRPRMSFEQFKRLCIAHHHTNRHAAASAAAVSVIEGASHLADLCRRWDVDSLSEMELRGLLGTLRSIATDDIDSLEESERKYCKNQVSSLRYESVEALFWDDPGVLELTEEFELSQATHRGGGTGVGIGEGQTAVDWRKSRMQEVERRAGRLESAARAVAFSADAVEAAVSSLSSGGSRLGLASGKFLRDTLGHGFGHRHGIFAVVGSLDEAVTSSSSSSSLSSSSTSTGRSRIPVEVVCVPRGLPSHARRSVEICAHAHRQLALSPRFPNYLGCVTHFTSGEGGGESERLTCFCYEHARMVPLRELLRRGGRLDESRPLFRFVAREVLLALNDALQMTSFRLLSPPDLENVFVGDAGVSLWLGKLNWGEELLPSDFDAATFHVSRERMLVRAYGRILHDCLHQGERRQGEARGSGPGGGDDDGDSEESIFTLEDCQAASSDGGCLRVAAGDVVTLLLPANTSRGFEWEDATVVMDDDISFPSSSSSSSSSSSYASGESVLEPMCGAEDLGGGLFRLRFKAKGTAAATAGTASSRVRVLLYCRSAFADSSSSSSSSSRLLPMASDPSPSLEVSVMVSSRETTALAEALISVCDWQGDPTGQTAPKRRMASLRQLLAHSSLHADPLATRAGMTELMEDFDRTMGR